MIRTLDLKQELRNTFGQVYLTIEVDLLHHWVHTTWRGHLTEEITKAGTNAYTQAVKDSGFRCVLNDSRKVVGRWDHSVQWALREWVPIALAAGIKFFALIAQPGSFSEESANVLTSNIHVFQMRIFYDINEAKDWLQQQCLNLHL